MTDWRPLSKRGRPDPRLDEPTEGLPAYLLGPITEWMRQVAYDEGYFRDDAFRRLQLRFKLDPPLDWRSERALLDDLLERMHQDNEFGFDVLDYILHHISEFTGRYERPIELAAKLAGILQLGGSAWEVVQRDDSAESFALSRRAVGPVREAIQALPSATRAHRHLVEAWNRLSGRQPDASGAYREAVRAVEAAAKPVVLPSADRATLGTMITAMRDKPEKWEVTLGAVDDVRRMMQLVWTNQLDRHGTDDESTPLNVTLEQADMAVHLCLSLVRTFVGGHLRATGTAAGVGTST